MISIAFDSSELFEFVAEYCQSHLAYKELQTHTAHPVYVSEASGAEGSLKKSFFLLGPDLIMARQNISWVYKNLHPSALLSFGFSDLCEPSENRSEMVPELCLRSAGHTEFGGNPVLYEDIRFDRHLQKTMASLFSTSSQGSLFGSDRKIYKKEDFDWIWRHLGCSTWDEYSGELLLAGKRFHCPVGCLKLFSTELSNQKKLALEYLIPIFELKDFSTH